jgi:hypothetical protein
VGAVFKYSQWRRGCYEWRSVASAAAIREVIAMKIRSTEIVKARIAEGLSQTDVTKHINKKQPWLSRVEHQQTLIALATEEQIVALIHRLGELRRAAAVAEKKLAANVSVPMRAPFHRMVRV